MSTSEKPLHIDIPVTLPELKAAFSVAALGFEGDLPASIFHLQLIAKDVADWKAKAQVIAVFHTNAGHVTLHDQAYNKDRMVSTGNPYKQLVADLMKRGVQVELCGATAAVHHWGNEDLLPGIKAIPTHVKNLAARAGRVRANHGMLLIRRFLCAGTVTRFFRPLLKSR